LITDGDARLIAAAPDLLAALLRVEKAIGNYNPAHPMAPGYFAGFQEAMAQAREAINKAGD
jgi:hypothetical protein